jgi:hypothetical protein
MNAAVARSRSWPLYAIPFAVAVGLLGMGVAGALHAQIGRSVLLSGMIVTSIAASLIGAIGGLILANTRRNVMWILAVALSMTALLALLAIVVSTLGPT